ncbi:distal long tail fiber assembly catalyst [Enterobacter phage fGh-Ecl01]|nr:distal long tail fiber assembly catalyst [Enterobacter phage fGh-Ecl01]USL86237.1 distal long tail fiber assembly catalyst [Enterobacter phage fGh-Ecl04]
MAIVGVPGWIGSSAVDETGERWMAQAGSKVRLTPPFWMSQMAGLSVYNIRFTVYERYYNNTRYRGQWGVGWYHFASKPSGYPAIEGNFEGLALGTCVAVQNIQRISVVTIQNGPAVNLRLTFSDGRAFDFGTDGRMDGGYRQYQIVESQVGAWYDYLNSKTGSVLEGLLTRR